MSQQHTSNELTVYDLLDASGGEKAVTKVTALDLSDKHLSEVPGVLDKVHSLKCLNLSFNRIESLGLLGRHKYLRELSLNSNAISNISDLASLRELRYLGLQYNNLTSCDNTLELLKKLGTLRLEGNNLDNDFGKLPASLKILDISENRLTSIERLDSLIALEELSVTDNNLQMLSGLTKCKRLESLNVSNNRIHSLADLQQLTNIRVLNLCSNALSSLASLPKMSRLEDLDLSSNQLETIEGLAKKCPHLEVLDIRHNPLTVQAIDEVMHLKELVELAIGDDIMTPERQSQLASALPHLEMINERPTRSTRPSPPNQGSATIKRPLMRSSLPIKATDVEQSNLAQLHDDLIGQTRQQEKFLQTTFDNIKGRISNLSQTKKSNTKFESHPLDGPLGRPASRSGARSRLASAKAFAAATSAAPGEEFTARLKTPSGHRK